MSIDIKGFMNDSRSKAMTCESNKPKILIVNGTFTLNVGTQTLRNFKNTLKIFGVVYRESVV